MRIGIDARMYGGDVSTGIGVYIKELINHLAIVDTTNIYIIFMCEPAFSDFQVPNERFSKVKVNIHWYTWREQVLLPWILLRHHLDLVHFPNFNVPVAYPKKFVTTIHDITPKFFPGHRAQSSAIRRAAYWLTVHAALRRSRRIITVSEFTKKNLIRYFNLKSRKIHVVHLGISSQYQKEAQSTDESIIRSVGITRPYVMYAGVWRYHKNIVGLVHAFDIIRAQCKTDCQLVLTGVADAHYPKIFQTIQNSPFKSDILLPGFVSDSALAALYRHADVVAVPSFQEGFGLVAAEASACGAAVAAAEHTSVEEVLGAGALYFDPYDSRAIAITINSILVNTELRRKLVITAQDKIKQYNWKSCAQNTRNIYAQL